ncbi:nucleotide sugar dehydrogenase [Pseudogracilibacillus sp. SO30301A]|uniref:nucleotide sugar dehydrogenase n=1 Tax=Pseudogracilibacillus sp. SO30301A TaxID=3098291 RepID=UPI00300DC036
MIDNCTVLFLGKHELIKYHLKQSFKTDDYKLIEKKEVKKKSSIPIIYPFRQKNIDMASSVLDEAMEWMIEKKLDPSLFFFININSRVQSSKIDQKISKLRDLCQSFVEITLDAGKDNSSIMINDIVKLSEVIKQYLNYLPKINDVKREINPNPKVGVVGLGYVGLPVALAFSEKFDVLGFDIDESKINMLKNNEDPTQHFSSSILQKANIEFVTEASRLKECNYIFVAVPTPITSAKKPNLTFLEHASALIGENLTPGTVVVFESTVYPGTTEQICLPILEKKSKLLAGKDFFVGYSPERINPGDDEYTFKNIPKVISGQNKETVEKIYMIYRHVLNGTIYKAPSIKVAEAAKIVENTQRDVNIALMNELSIIFDVLNISTDEVINAAKTKWNFIPFSPGLVGGHCIGVDPYYLIYKSTQAGYHPKFIFSAREVNDEMPNYIVKSLLQLVVKHRLDIKNLTVTVLGITFKENISDIRNSKSLEVVKMLQGLNINVQVHDPYASKDELLKHGIQLKEKEELNKADILIVAVPHKVLIQQNRAEWQSLCKEGKGIVMDLKTVLPGDTFSEKKVIWSL